MPGPIAVDDVVEAFGGQRLGPVFGNVEDPGMLLAVRDELMRRLRSTGGRPGLSGTLPQRVQVSAVDWQKIVAIADHIEVGRHKPSPAQVASILVHLALERVTAAEIDDCMRAAS